MRKELILLRHGKPVEQKDVTKIANAIQSDKESLPYVMSEFLELCENAMKSESTFSILLENVFENMKVEIVRAVPETLEIEEAPVLIRELSGYNVLFFEEEKGFTVICPSLPGCGTEGDTEKEAIKNAKEAIKGYLECAQKHGVTVRQ